MHHHADANLDDILWQKRRWNGSQAYAESKLPDAMLAFAIARRWPNVLSNSLGPGWVSTKMGGRGALDDMDQAHLTQAWLAAGNDPSDAAIAPGQGYARHVVIFALPSLHTACCQSSCRPAFDRATPIRIDS
jgi:NAD(P)-dependent dehydrogenase (short-subunit alcohol dehydrogenase family)